jgi:hypothetical protein
MAEKHVLFISQPAAMANVIIAAANDLNENELKQRVMTPAGMQ